MASINLSGSDIVIQADNTSLPVTIVNWAECFVSYQEPSQVRFTVGEQGWIFGPWEITPSGELLEVDGVDVSAMTAAQKAAAILADIIPVFDAAKATEISVNGDAFTVVGPGVPLAINIRNSDLDPVGTINGTNIDVGDADITINGDTFTTVVSEGAVDIPVIDTNTDPVGSKVGNDWVVPAA